MAERIDQVTIVGGGTAGWLTALILQTFLNRRQDEAPVSVTLIESPTIPTIGVGEATVRGIANLLRQLGINEREFMRRCNATFKLAAEFPGWNVDRDGKPIYFLHPFNFPKPLDGINPSYHFKRYGSRNGAKAAEALTWNQAIITHMKGPRPLGGQDYQAVVFYAYHLDASLFGNFLRETAVERGVRRIEDDVTGAEVDERGHITKLNLERNGEHAVKLVIDCSGFRSILMQGVLKEEFLPYSQHLLNDRAMVTQIPIPVDRPLPCATRATALTSGWVFRVPLAERIGTGYIHSSSFKSEEAAREEFVAHLRTTGDLTPDMPDPDVKLIRMKTGHTKRAWVGNCLAIGLANGFVEPLEATAIYMVESAARWLVNYFPDQGIDPVFAEAFNRRMDGLYDEIRDFLAMHFCTSNREEPFWRACREPGVAPDRLMEQLRLWKHALPSDQDMFYKGLFGEWNYLYCLWEKGYFDQERYPLTPLATEQSWRQFEDTVYQTTQQLLRTLPDHRLLLSEIRGERQQAAAAAPDYAGPLLDVGGDGAWQAAKPVYATPRPQPGYAAEPQSTRPAPGVGVQPQAAKPAPAYGAQAQAQAASPPPPAVNAWSATIGSFQQTPAGYETAAPSGGTLQYDVAPPGPQGEPARSDTQPAQPQATTFPGTVGLTFGSEAPPTPPPAPQADDSPGLTFGAAPPAPSPGPAEAAQKRPASPLEEALAKRFGARPTVRFSR